MPDRKIAVPIGCVVCHKEQLKTYSVATASLYFLLLRLLVTMSDVSEKDIETVSARLYELNVYALRFTLQEEVIGSFDSTMLIKDLCEYLATHFSSLGTYMEIERIGSEVSWDTD